MRTAANGASASPRRASTSSPTAAWPARPLDAALAGGVDMVQLRDPELDDEALLDGPRAGATPATSTARCCGSTTAPTSRCARRRRRPRRPGRHARRRGARGEAGEELLVGLSTHRPSSSRRASRPAPTSSASAPCGRRRPSPAVPPRGSSTCAPPPARGRRSRGSPSAGIDGGNVERWPRRAPSGSSWCARSARPPTPAPRPPRCAPGSRGAAWRSAVAASGASSASAPRAGGTDGPGEPRPRFGQRRPHGPRLRPRARQGRGRARRA